MADDKTISETIIDGATALQKWKAIEPFATEVKSLVNEYSEIIDGIGSVFAVVGFVWNIYSNMEKAKEDAAQQQAMVVQITRAVDGMITRATAEIKHHIDQNEVKAAVIAVNAVQQGFRNDVLPYATTYPLTGFDAGPLDLLINDARKVIETLHELIPARAEVGDGAAILILYRNLHAIVQCKLTLDKWRRGLTQAVVAQAENETVRLIQVWVSVVRGFQRMSDLSFSQGIVYFHVGGHGRPELTRYSYYYKGKAQAGGGSNRAAVSQAFIEARKAARSDAVPQQVFEWNKAPYKMWEQLRELKDKVPIPPQPPAAPSGPPTIPSRGSAPVDAKTWFRLKSLALPSTSIDVVNDPTRAATDAQLQLVPEGNFSGQFWHFRPSETAPGRWNLSTLFLGNAMRLDVYGDDKTRPHLSTAGSYSGQQWQLVGTHNNAWSLSNAYSGPDMFLTARSEPDGSMRLAVDLREENNTAQMWVLSPIRPVTEVDL